MPSPPAFRRFVAIDEHDCPHLLKRLSAREIGLDTERYGIASRLIAGPGVSVQDLGIAALHKLLAEHDLPRGRLAAVVFSSRVYHVHEAARELAARAGLPCQATGIERACSGFPAATREAMRLYEQFEGPVAVVTAEILSTNINWELPQGTPEDHPRARGQAAKLFGDGAAAVLVDGETSGDTILDAWQGEVPDEHELIQKTDVEDSADPFGQVRPGITVCMTMPGRRGLLLVKRAPQIMADSVMQSLRQAADAGHVADEATLDHVIPHQANGLITTRLEQELARRFPTAPRVWSCIEQVGNTVSASIPTAMANVQDQLPRGALVAMPSVGAGGPGYRPNVLSTGCVLVRRPA